MKSHFQLSNFQLAELASYTQVNSELIRLKSTLGSIQCATTRYEYALTFYHSLFESYYDNQSNVFWLFFYEEFLSLNLIQQEHLLTIKSNNND